MESATAILDLLVEWEERRDRGEAVTPEELCAAAPYLTARLRQAIGRLEACDRLLDADAAGSAAAPAASVPAQIGKYQIQRELGHGGMGVVYLAWDPALCRTVALKVLQPCVPVSSEDLRRLARRFRQEMQVLARLRHESIVPIYEATLDDNDRPYFVMEYLPGGTVADHRKRLTAAGPATVAAVLERVARAVGYAHAQSVLHRDLKPGNMLLDDDGRPRVSDFGLAKLLDQTAIPEDAVRVATTRADEDTADYVEAATQLTAGNQQPGTWPYMAPEQFEPAFGPIRKATDVWALGVILYELLTGERPFPGHSREELRERVCRAPMPPFVAQRPRHLLHRPLTRRLESITRRCLEKDPAKRFRTGGELADALRRAAAPRRRRFAAIAVLAVAVGLFAFWPRSPAWPSLPGVQAASARLRLKPDEDVVLVERGRRVEFDWAMGLGSGRELKNDDGLFTVTSIGGGGCLVELLPGLPPGRYEVEATLKHQLGFDQSVVGIYACGSRYRNARGWQNLFASLTYADIGPLAVIRGPATDGSRPGGWVRLQAHHLGENDRSAACVNVRDQAARRHVATAQSIGLKSPEWRRIALRVDEAGIGAGWDGEELGQMTETKLIKLRESVCESRRDISADRLPVNIHGSLGVYVYNGTVTVRDFRVRRLP